MPLSKILIVDDEPTNLQVLRVILDGEYQMIYATDGEKALSAAARHMPDLILMDIQMPDMDGYEVCGLLKANPDTAAIPVIFVTTLDETGHEKRGFDVGGVDYITKPVSPPVVAARVATHLALHAKRQSLEAKVRARTRDLEGAQHDAITMLGEAGHYNDTDTGDHIWRMAAYSAALARAAGWPEEKTALLELAAPMHDTGKIGIPDSILKKPAKLSDEEWEIMRTHTTIGHGILSRSETPLFLTAAEVALNHHEKWDGSGYPRGLNGGSIPFSARIVAIADVFDALTTRRPYKAPWPMPAAFEEIRKGAGTHFDPDLAKLFTAIGPEIATIRRRFNDGGDAADFDGENVVELKQA